MAVKVYEPTQIRNIVLIGHGGCGKTSLAEAMLFITGATTRLGKTLEKTSLLDFEPEEQKRGSSMATALAWTECLGVKLNILDTPGDGNFFYDALYAMRGADAAVLVVSATDGVESNTERLYHEAVKLGLPVAIYVSKMDRELADPDRVLNDVREVLGAKAFPCQVPIGRDRTFRGVCSLFSRKAYIYPMNGSGKYDKVDIPAEYQAEVDGAWQRLIDEVATTNDEIMEKVLEGETLTDEEVHTTFQEAMLNGQIVPLIYGAATECVGALSVSELAVWAFPNPLKREVINKHALVEAGHMGDEHLAPDAPFLAQVLHTTIDEQSGKISIIRVLSGAPPPDGTVLNSTRGVSERLGSLVALRGHGREVLSQGVCGDIVAVPKLKDTRTGDTLCDPKHVVKLETFEIPPPMMTLVLKPASKNDEDKLKTAVERVLEEDPTLSVGFEELTHHMVLHGMGQSQIEVAIERMRRKYKVVVETDLPPVPYRETLKRAVSNVEGKHKKQTGGAGQFGVCVVNVAPLERGGGFQFEDNIVGGAIPRQYIPSVEKGLRSRLKRGFMAGYPIEDVRVELIDGKYHPVDSKDVAFQMAGSKALRAAFDQGGSVLLEPIQELSIVCPVASMGDILGDVNGRRGRVAEVETGTRNAVIKAHVPLAEVLRYAADLKAMTGGKGVFTMRPYGYEEVPSHLVQKIVDASPFHMHDDDDE